MAETFQKEDVRILVAEVGYDETSKRTGIKAGTLRQWARRFQWHKPFVHSQTVTSVTQRPAAALSAILAERKAQSRSLLSEYQVRAATEASEHPKPLSITRQVNDLASIHAKVWPEEQTASNVFSLNVLSINMLDEGDA